ncbi:MAG: hypothetical protein ACREEA_08190 [Stellaceae bacterium]
MTTDLLSVDIRRINELLIRALRALGDDGHTDLACRIAADAWSMLRRTHPGEAAKLNGALHYLTQPKPQKGKGDRHV